MVTPGEGLRLEDRGGEEATFTSDVVFFFNVLLARAAVCLREKNIGQKNKSNTSFLYNQSRCHQRL